MFKKILAIFCILMAFLAVFTAIKGKDVIIEKDISLGFHLNEDLKEALYTASLAPSSHNSQNWIVKISQEDEKLYVLLDEKRILPEVDPHKREAYISAGAFVETLILALKAYGYESQITINDEEMESLVAVIDYKRSTTEKNMDILATIEKRHTDKRKYKNADIAQEAINHLLKMDDIYYYPKLSSEFQYISQGTIEAYNKQSETFEKKKELSEWLRFSNKEAKEKQDGLPAEQLGLTGIIKVIYYLTTNRETSQKNTFAKQGQKKTKEQALNHSGFFIITGNDTKSELIKTGMRLQSFWLLAAEKNIAIQPMSQMLEETPYKDKIQEKLNIDKPVQMILRAGIVNDYGKNHKIRRDIKEFVFLDK